VTRGGSWGDEPRFGRSAMRDKRALFSRFSDGGFRVARMLL
jgi:formylglycine-generating enzyme required for sulfatase activity